MIVSSYICNAVVWRKKRQDSRQGLKWDLVGREVVPLHSVLVKDQYQRLVEEDVVAMISSALGRRGPVGKWEVFIVRLWMLHSKRGFSSDKCTLSLLTHLTILWCLEK